METILACENLTKRFGGLTAVDRLSFSAHSGKITGIIGANGAGKTTLFNLITGFYKPEKGSSIRFDNREIAGIQPHTACHRGLARTFQITKLFPSLSVLHNVVIGALSRTNKVRTATQKAEEILHQVGLDRWTKSLAQDLPIGHRKKLELARTLATEPKLLLLDEVMGGLVPLEVKELIDLLRKINSQGVSMLMIEHVMSALMSLSERVVVMDHGAKIAEGTPNEVVNNPAVIEAYLGDGMVLVDG